MTNDEFDACMRKLGAAVGKAMVADQVEMWANAFLHLPLAKFAEGLNASLRDWKFAGFPPIGFVAERCGLAGSGLSDDQAAVIAWGTVLKAISSYGSYVSIEWPDPIIAEAISTNCASWPALCAMTSEDLVRFQKPKFIESYKAHKAAGTKGTGVTLGLLAADASRAGYEPPQPVRIGSTAPKRIGGEVPRSAPAVPYKRLAVVGQVAQAMRVPEVDEPDHAPQRKPLEPPPALSAMQHNETAALVSAQKKMLELRYGKVDQ